MTKQTFDSARRDALRLAYGAAIAASEADFEFQGQLYYSRYAGYLLRHLDDYLGQAEGLAVEAPRGAL